MTKFEPAGWQMLKPFRAPSNRTSFDNACKPSAGATIVQQVDPPYRLPATPIEHRLISALKKSAVSLEKLVKTVAADLYAEELRKGCRRPGYRTFRQPIVQRSDVVRELNAGDGILWEIKSERKSL